jgi:hypothetical protein
MDNIEIESSNSDKFGPTIVRSFWGAIASLPVLQVFGFIAFQAFVNSIFKFSLLRLMIDLFSLLFLIAYLTEQTMLFSRIDNYIRHKNLSHNKLKFIDIVKILIGSLFLILWLSFIFGYYPLQEAVPNILHTILFYFISWSISSGLLFIRQSPNLTITEGVAKSKRGLLILILIPFVFLALLFPPEMMYLFLMIPIFAIYVLLVSWMVEA